jgi:hypothetical protein
MSKWQMAISLSLEDLSGNVVTKQFETTAGTEEFRSETKQKAATNLANCHLLSANC